MKTLRQKQDEAWRPEIGNMIVNVDPPHQKATVLECRRARLRSYWIIRVKEVGTGQEFDSVACCWQPWQPV